MFLLVQNIFIVPTMQHGCRAKPLLAHYPWIDIRRTAGSLKIQNLEWLLSSRFSRFPSLFVTLEYICCIPVLVDYE